MGQAFGGYRSVVADQECHGLAGVAIAGVDQRITVERRGDAISVLDAVGVEVEAAGMHMK